MASQVINVAHLQLWWFTMCMFIMYKSMDSKQDTIEENLNQVEPRSKTSVMFKKS